MNPPPDPLRLNTNPDGTQGYPVPGVQTLEMPGASTYIATLTENGVPVAPFHHHGHGGATLVNYNSPEAQNRLFALRARYPDLHREGAVPVTDESFTGDLVSDYAVNEQAQTNSMFRSSRVNALGTPELFALAQRFTPAQLRAWPERPGHLTHVWLRGQGWMPLEDAP